MRNRLEQLLLRTRDQVLLIHPTHLIVIVKLVVEKVSLLLLHQRGVLKTAYIQVVRLLQDAQRETQQDHKLLKTIYEIESLLLLNF